MRVLRCTPAILALGVTLAVAGPGPAAAQSELERFCDRPEAPPSDQCGVVAATAALVHPRVGLALWGGAPVPGSASTLGMRIGPYPRVDLSTRLTLVPAEAPPLANLLDQEGNRGLIAAVSGQAAVGILTGWSPLPTVGGVLSLDAIVRASWARLPDGAGFDDDGVFGLSAGLRVGALRESFTLPGISLTASYGRSAPLDFGERGGDGDGYLSGAIGNWNATAAATKRIGPVGVSVGGSLDRYVSEVDFGYRAFPGLAEGSARSEVDRWSAFANVSWTFLIAHASLELGWQDAPVPDGLPPALTLDPAHWWVGAGLRLSI